jgi:cytochrome oxidase Cu insertion factor (SCO1/SenC/PrrC family)
MVAGALIVWMGATLFWWAFAFAPLPPEPPPWLTAARQACFGAPASGLPDAAGWIMLVLAPAMLFGALVAVWGRDVGGVLARALASRWGRAGLAVLVLTAGTEAIWVADRIATAARIERVELGPAAAAALPAEYPRATAPAPGFALVDQHGATVDPAHLRGRPIVLSFVFAHCATVCPMVVETLKRATAAPDPPVMLLVTLDPWRDRPSALAALAGRWQLPPHAHVLSAARAGDVVDVARAYAVPFSRDEATGDITHPVLVFVIDREGRLAYTFNNPSADWITQALVRIG